MALVQVRLIPVYRRLSVTPGSGSWALTFAYAAAAADALVWLTITKPPGAAGSAIAVITLLTAFASWIAFRTVVPAVRGQLLPAWPPADRCAECHRQVRGKHGNKRTADRKSLRACLETQRRRASGQERPRGARPTARRCCEWSSES